MKATQSIIYIMSNQRSGSTLIENILSKSSETVSLGESYLLGGYIHRTGPGEVFDWRCSCGATLEECKFWNEVYDQIGINHPGEIKSTKIVDPNDKEALPNQKELNEEVVMLMNKIYKAIFKITGRRVLIDSSKEAYNGLELYRNSPYNFKFIYLKRDLRAVTISKQNWRKKYSKKDVGLIKLLLANYIHRLKCKLILFKVNKKDVFNINYEDFFKNPQQTLDEMSEFFGFAPFTVPEYMEPSDDHTIAGTPNRVNKRKIQYDNRWSSVAKKKPFFNMLGYLLNKVG